MRLNPLPILTNRLMTCLSIFFYCPTKQPLTQKGSEEDILAFHQTDIPKDDLHIFFAVNDGYAKQLCVTLVSILENNQNEVIHFYVLSNDFSGKNKQAVEKIKKKYKNFDITYLKPDKKLFENFKLTVKYITIEGYYRYLIADMAPHLKKALYMDADLVVNGSLRKLWDTALGGVYCAGVRDLCIERLNYKKRLGLSQSDLYINSGVLLLNLEQIRRDKMTHKLFQNTLKLMDAIYFQDQDIINVTFNGKIKQVDSIYNFTSENIKQERFKASKAIVIHYTGGTKKPWKDICNNKLQYVWKSYEYLNELIQLSDEKELEKFQIKSCLLNERKKQTSILKNLKRIKKLFFKT